MTQLLAYNQINSFQIYLSEEDLIMSRKEGYSRKGLFGTISHYDSNGRKTGSSRQGIFGGINHYDENGHKKGHSTRGIFGDWNHYDE